MRSSVEKNHSSSTAVHLPHDQALKHKPPSVRLNKASRIQAAAAKGIDVNQILPFRSLAHQYHNFLFFQSIIKFITNHSFPSYDLFHSKWEARNKKQERK